MLRIIGIVLIVAGIASLGQGALRIAKQSATAEAADSDELARLDAVVPGLILTVVGFVLTSIRRGNSTVSAVPADQSVSLHLTDEAAEFVRRTMHDGKYPPDSGIRIVQGNSQDSLEVQFDFLSEDGGDFLGEDKGISVFVEKSLAPKFDGRTVGLVNRKLTVLPPEIAK